MQQDTHESPVIFKKEGADVCAFFPEEPGTYSPHTCTAYAHIGQHSAADVSYAAGLKRAQPDEFAALKRELEGMGYRLRIVRKFTQKHLQTRRDALARIR